MESVGIDKLDALNRLLVARNGIVPFDVVFLIGSTKDINKAMDLEKEVVGQFIKDNVLSEMPGIYLTDLKNAKSILEQHRFKSMNIDVTGLAPSYDYETFINDLGFEDVDSELLDQILSDDLREQIMLDRDTVVMETLLCHFEHHDDNKLYPDDFDWFYIKEAKTEEPSQIAEPLEEPETIEEPIIEAPVIEESVKEEPVITESVPEKPIMTDKPVVENRKPKQEMFKHTTPKPAAAVKNETQPKSEDKAPAEEKKPVHGNGASLFANYRNAPVKKEIKVGEEPTEDDEMPLKPEEVKKKKPTYISKDSLTEEEDSKNEILLNGLREKYTEGIKFVEETCNSQYRIILNKMQDALEKNVYKTQFCPLYLEISDDRRTPLYHKLYEIDMATIEFQKNVVHQVVHMGCAFCNKEWDEDVTFYTKGPHFIKCPSCSSLRPFEKM